MSEINSSSHKDWSPLGRPLLLALSFVLLSGSCFGQNLFEERVRKIEGKKKSIYLEKGIIHNGSVKVQSELKAIRHFYDAKNGYERVVFDFSTKQVPRIYGYMASKEKKLYLDFSDTKIPSQINSFGDSKYVEGINFYPVSQDSLSVELNFKNNASIDVFYLESDGRLVVDIKES